ncbi:glutathione peroxidase [Cryobacterium sp. MP_M5]|uniref:glutathione peroxidase n=1 Tax=unclassified Cryobacterium TaxID=2649013 RepID=UPI0018CA217D|nr:MULTISPECIES: glutathione peroxidase [unclassified Cryobacterium]MBG6057437.1 glutathione peroxidase [Cryobacterium sp. MP_M3]MEC5175636.1 glutathione peroxidase [Cryobacterium sp. MP_M5]
MSASALYETPLTLIDGTETTFGQFRGKTVLVVNVASKCGFTPQYAGLEALYEKYADDGLVVLGLPCNQFMGQEPGDEASIESFCQLNFGVTFPLTEKVDVRGRNQHPLYAQLTKFKSGLLPGLIKWNFEKFLVSPTGEIVDRFASTVEPESDEIVRAIEKTLAASAA